MLRKIIQETLGQIVENSKCVDDLKNIFRVNIWTTGLLPSSTKEMKLDTKKKELYIGTNVKGFELSSAVNDMNSMINDQSCIEKIYWDFGKENYIPGKDYKRYIIVKFKNVPKEVIEFIQGKSSSKNNLPDDVEEQKIVVIDEKDRGFERMRKGIYRVKNALDGEYVYYYTGGGKLMFGTFGPMEERYHIKVFKDPRLYNSDGEDWIPEGETIPVYFKVANPGKRILQKLQKEHPEFFEND
jgi:hypothetical protein